MLCRSAARTQNDSAEKYGCEEVLDGTSHDLHFILMYMRLLRQAKAILAMTEDQGSGVDRETETD